MKKIKEVIVVEGKNDYEKIKKCVNADVEITSGFYVSNNMLKRLKQYNETRGIIVFTDPDSPGEAIRNKIINYVGTCKHASLSTKQSRKGKKVGIEHANCSDIIEALESCATYIVDNESLRWIDFVDLGLTGASDSQKKRDYISKHYSMPITNGKRCFKYLNMMNISRDELESLLKEIN